VSQKTEWRRFVEARRAELHDDYPCAMPTRRALCPKHGTRVGPVTGICKPCRDELYEQLAGEYVAAAKQQRGDTTMTTDTVDGELLPDVIDHSPTAPSTLFHTDDPDVALQRMSKVATALVGVIRDRKLVVSIRGREHLTAEAWTTLGGMLGVVPVVEWTRPLADGAGWEARVEARTLDGRVVGAAESMCTRSEQTWHDRDEFALRSMAQTRAIGRALRAPLGQIVRLAGYDPAGAEEIPAEPAEPEPAPPERSRGKILEAHQPTRAQAEELNATLRKLRELAPNIDWPAVARKAAGVPTFDCVTRTMARSVLETLRGHLAELEYPDTKGASDD
jgi:hypothetical protein